MKTNGLFTIHEFRIPFKSYGEPIYLIPFGDIHRSAPLCHVEKWLEFLAWARKKPNAFFLGMGDYDDLVSTSEREGLRGARMHDSTIQTIEQIYRQHTDRLAKEIGFMKDKCLGLIEGNHYGVFQNGTTTTQRLCESLNCKYLGCSSFIRLTFYPITKAKTTHSIDIWAHHGVGASRLVGGSINNVARMMSAAEADIYLMGHDHHKSAAPVTRLRLNSGAKLKLSHRKALLCRTGSFLRGFVPEEVSYVVDAAYSPTDLGVVKIEMTPRRDQSGDSDDAWIDLHASI